MFFRFFRAMLLATMVCGICSADTASDGEKVWQSLLDTAPALDAPSEARQAALKALDAWIARPGSEKTEECVAYYRRAVDRALDAMEKERPKKGLRVFQLYSSSVIVQTPSVAIGIDLDQGPNESAGKTPEEEQVAFCMTDRQVARLADIVDYSFHTHAHGDHVDREITQALLERGKTVVGTDDIRQRWAGEAWAEAIVVPEQTLGRGLKIGALDVNVLWDHQWNNEAHTSGTACNAYLITVPEGLTVGVKGDINCGLRLYGWLEVLAEKGCAIDVMVGSAIYWKGPGVAKQIDALYAPLWIPGHAWEFGHRPADEARGNAMGFWQAYSIIKMNTTRGGATPLSWGEYVDITERGTKGSK